MTAPMVTIGATRHRLIQIGKRLGLAVLVAGMVAYAMAPFAWLLISSVQAESEITSVPPRWIPHEPTLDNFREILLRRPMDVSADFDKKMGAYGTFPTKDILPGLWNSLRVATVVVLVNIVLAGLAAYGFARLTFRFKQGLFYMVLLSRIVPDISLIIPFYILLRRLGLLDTLAGLAISHIGISLPLTVFILVGYFETIPGEIEKAARVDGCTRLQVLWRVILPLSKPALIAAGLFSFLASWNEFLFALLTTATMKARTVPVLLTDFATEMSVSFARMNAATVIIVIPPILMALLFHRHFVRGLTAGAVKG